MVIPHSISRISATITTLNRWVHFAGEKVRYYLPFVDGRLKAQGPEATNHTQRLLLVELLTIITAGPVISRFPCLQIGQMYWRFRLPDPLDRQDLSGNSNNATNVGASWQTSVKKFYDGAAEFVKPFRGCRILCFRDRWSRFSCEFWLHPTTLSGDLVPLAVGGSGSSNQYFITSTGSVYLFYGQSDQVISPVGSIRIGQWQHCAVSRSSGHLRVFVNGSIVTSIANSGSEFDQ